MRKHENEICSVEFMCKKQFHTNNSESEGFLYFLWLMGAIFSKTAQGGAHGTAILKQSYKINACCSVATLAGTEMIDNWFDFLLRPTEIFRLPQTKST